MQLRKAELPPAPNKLGKVLSPTSGKVGRKAARCRTRAPITEKKTIIQDCQLANGRKSKPTRLKLLAERDENEELVILLKLIESVLWQSLQRPGLERLELSQVQNGWLLRGTILTDSETGPAEAAYQIACDSNWRTQQADISLRHASGERRVQITTQNGCWYENGKENQAVAEAIDIDLGWSPSTNTLPIRRLNLAIGQSSGPVVAAWISLPDLRLQPLPQEYTRRAKDRYLYTSAAGAFKAEIMVNDHGVVLEYENFWRRVDSGGGGSHQ